MTMGFRAFLKQSSLKYLVLIILLVTDSVFGNFNEPSLEPLGSLPEGITFDQSISWSPSITIPENIPAADLPLRLAKFSLTPGGGPVDFIGLPPASFSIENENSDYFFTLTTQLDREAKDSYSFRIVDSGGSGVGNSIDIQIFVKDLNDNPVELSYNSADIADDYEEFGTVPLNLTRFVVTDPDIDDTFTFQIKDLIGTEGTFEVHSTNFDLSIAKQLDYKRFAMHRIEVTVFDTNEVHSDSVIIPIYVKDIPNQPPEWVQFPTTLTINEGYVDTVLTTVTARDGDYQLNWKMHYSIVESHYSVVPISDYLRITADTGEIRLVQDRIVDASEYYSLTESLSFTIEITAKEIAESPYDPTDEKEVKLEITVLIRDENNEFPEICNIPNPSFEDTCERTETYTVEIAEDFTGILDFNNKALVIRDLDPTISLSRYTVEYVANPLIETAFELQPRKETIGSGITEYTLQVKNIDHIDFEGPIPNPANFELIFRERFPDGSDGGDATAARAAISVTITDINDNSPIFDRTDDYVFYVCENMKVGDPIMILNYDPASPRVCPENQTPPTVPAGVKATDDDKSPAFNTISYSWSQQGRGGVEINPTTGLFRIIDEENFDYEVFKDVWYIAEASDGERKTPIGVRFVVLDVQDSDVDITSPGTRFDVRENTTKTDPIVTITATCVDENPDIEFDPIEVINVIFSESHKNQNVKDSLAEQCDPDISLEDQMKEWFKLEWQEDPGAKSISAHLMIGSRPIDREGCGIREVDRVDLIVRAHDKNYVGQNPPGKEIQFSITILDINDNPPRLEDGMSEIEVSIRENEGVDNPQEVDQEITIIRVTDPDLVSNFHFEIKAVDCIAEFCDEVTDLVMLKQDAQISSKVALIRKAGRIIDREETKYYGIKTDVLKYTIDVHDDYQNEFDHVITIQVSITVDDLNDQIPQFEELEYDKLPLEIYELVDTELTIFQFQATDEDDPEKPYGQIRYEIVSTNEPNDGYNEFKIDPNTGVLTPIIPPLYEWSQHSAYKVTIRARDMPDTNIGLSSTVAVNIIVIDGNNNDPQFITEPEDPDGFLERPYETWLKPGEALNKTIVIQDIDNKEQDGNGVFTVELREVTITNADGVEEVVVPKPFAVGAMTDVIGNQFAKEMKILATQSFENNWGTYTLHFFATDEGDGPRTGERSYRIKVENENLHEPVFVFPHKDGSEKTLIALNHQVNTFLQTWYGEDLDKLHATDADDGSIGNGQVRYELEEEEDNPDDAFQYFEIRQERLYLKESLASNIEAKFFTLRILAIDRGDPNSLSTNTSLKMFVVPDNNREPLFEDNSPMFISFNENLLQEKEIREAMDPDSELVDNPDYPDIPIGPQIIYYHIVGGRRILFDPIDTSASPPLLKNSEELDREGEEPHGKEFQLVLYVSNDATPPTQSTEPEQVDPNDKQYLLINIEVENDFDEPPAFVVKGVITAGFSTSQKNGDIISTIVTTDLDDEDLIAFSVSTFTPSDPTLNPVTPFILVNKTEGLNSLSTDVQLTFDPQSNMRGFYTFEITAKDRGGIETKAQCKFYMIKDFNVVLFTFDNSRDVVLSKSYEISEVLTDTFSYRCNIDKISAVDNDVSRTIVEAHFVNLEINEPVHKSEIEDQQLNTSLYTKLFQELAQIGIILPPDGIGRAEQTPQEEDKLSVYLLIGGVAILAVLLIVMSVTCYFNNRSLSRKVRALTATTFGSQISGLNRTGAVMDLPNTNEFAIEGSNPMWTTNGGNEKKIPDFDAESVGSGGSVLIGVEDDDDFKNYKSAGDFGSPQFDDDYTADIYDTGANHSSSPRQSNGRNGLYQSDSEPEGFGGDDRGMPPPPGFGDGNTRMNPLVNMGYDDQDD